MVNIPLFTWFHTSQVLSRISSINSMSVPQTRNMPWLNFIGNEWIWASLYVEPCRTVPVPSMNSRSYKLLPCTFPSSPRPGKKLLKACRIQSCNWWTFWQSFKKKLWSLEPCIRWWCRLLKKKYGQNLGVYWGSCCGCGCWGCCCGCCCCCCCCCWCWCCKSGMSSTIRCCFYSLSMKLGGATFERT